MTFTASFHNGGMEENGVDSKGRTRKKLRQACREHNIRDPAYCDKQDHIIKGGVHEIWIDIPPKVAYEKIFGKPFRDYNGNLVKGAPHLHLDYIPVAYKCERGQKVQNSMNGALKEQGIVNIEIDAETALKMFGIRDKSRKKKRHLRKTVLRA